tara:strand:- start:33727 stop:35445 length:1719 start_codon:yes stop_codon:yes gene_type:complete
LNSDGRKNQDLLIDREIGISQIIDYLLKNKKLIGFSVLFSFCIGLFYTLYQKRIWEGQFQIVLVDKNQRSRSFDSSLQSEAIFLDRFGIFDGDVEVKTEVEILKSPKVLMPVYDFFKSNNKSNLANPVKYSFLKWRKDHLDVNLMKGTKVLNISFQDENRDIILPLLVKISNAYQKYSGETRQTALKSGIEYLNDQIDLYKIKSTKAISEAKNYASKQNLGFLTLVQGENREFVVDTERDYINASNEIRFIDQHLELLEKIKNNPEKNLYLILNILSSTKEYTSFASETLYNRYINIDSKLSRLKTFYTNQDPEIKRLETERLRTLNILLETINNELLAQRIKSGENKAASKRPIGVISFYKELLANTQRIETTLKILESQKNALLLADARKQNPWSLITEPYILDYPVSPSRKKILLIFIIGGFLFGSIFSLVKELRKDLLSDPDVIASLLDLPEIERLSINSKDKWKESTDFLVDGLLLNSKLPIQNISIVSVGATELDIQDFFVECLKKSFKSESINISTKLQETNKCDQQILLIPKGRATRLDLLKLNMRLKLQSTKVIGWIFINDLP